MREGLTADLLGAALERSLGAELRHCYVLSTYYWLLTDGRGNSRTFGSSLHRDHCFL